MRKKIPINLLLTAVIVIVALFAVTKAMAQERPVKCEAAQGKYTLAPAPGFDFPYYQSGVDGEDDCDGNAGWVWRYRLTPRNPKFLPKINKAHFYIPSSPPNIIEVWGVLYRGLGGTSGWNDFNYNGIVVTTENISGGGEYIDYSFCTKEVATYGTITAVLDTGEGELACIAEETDVQGPVGGIVGPGFDVSEIVLAADYQNFDLPEGGCVRVKRHPLTGCIQKFQKCDGSDITPTSTRPSWLTEDIADFGDPNNRFCRGGIIATSGSPIVYWGWTPPNNYYCIGVYDPAVPSWTTSPCPPQ